MARSRPFSLFILVLCLLACVCAHGEVSKEEAERIVSEAKAAAKKTLNNAKDNLFNAERCLENTNAHKRSAERAAAEAAEAANGIQAAEAIAQKVKEASDKALKLHQEISASAKASVDKMKPLVTKATKLDTKATAIEIETEDTDGYTKAKESAEAVKNEVDALDKEIKTASGLTLSYNKLNEMSEFVKTAELAKYHLDAIVAVAKIDTLLESADNDIKLTEEKRDEINATVQEINKLIDTSPQDVIHYFSSIYITVQGQLRSASYQVDEAKQAKEDMVEQKKQADAVLAKVKDETDVIKAKQEAESANLIAQEAEEKLKDTKRALESATTSAIGASYQKKAAEKAPNKRAKKPDAPQENDKTNPHDSSNTHQPVQDTTESLAGSGTMQPTVTNTDQSMSEQPVRDTTESPVVIETMQPTITNSGPPGSGWTKPTKPSSSDSAMTVSVLLLLALIACAALH